MLIEMFYSNLKLTAQTDMVVLAGGLIGIMIWISGCAVVAIKLPSSLNSQLETAAQCGFPLVQN